MGPTSPSPRQVHNILSREGRDPPWLFFKPPLFFSRSCLPRSVAENNYVQHATCATHLGDCCIFYVANEGAELQDLELVNNGDHFVTNQVAVASVAS